MPSDQVFPLRLQDVPPGPLDDGAPATLAERAEQAQAQGRRAWLALGNVAQSEREVAELLEKDPGRVTRDIVAGGWATFTVDDVDRWTCSRLSDYGPDWEEHVLRYDPTIRVRSADTEHPLFTTEQHLELETRVFAKASRLAQQRDPLFDPTALERAIADTQPSGMPACNVKRRLVSATDQRRPISPQKIKARPQKRVKCLKNRRHKVSDAQRPEYWKPPTIMNQVQMYFSLSLSRKPAIIKTERRPKSNPLGLFFHYQCD
jgi:hypothetical protein